MPGAVRRLRPVAPGVLSSVSCGSSGGAVSHATKPGYAFLAMSGSARRALQFIGLVAAAFVVARPGRSTADPGVAARPSTCSEGMAALAGGTFVMGERHDTVTVSPFCLDRTEVTVDAYAACVGSHRCTADHLGELTFDGATFTADARCNYGTAGRGLHPMNCVDWTQAATYCRAQGKRLPTEEEWEWAARGGPLASTYPWGEGAPDLQACWSGTAKRAGTCVVGSNPLGDAPGGIHDLAGNVIEWTATSSSGSDTTSHVARGGSWGDDDASGMRAADRVGVAPSYRMDYLLGFRCSR
jgi:formylglycine-generating enzyme